MGYTGPYEIDAATRSFLEREPALFIGGKRVAGASAARISSSRGGNVTDAVGPTSPSPRSFLTARCREDRPCHTL